MGRRKAGSKNEGECGSKRKRTSSSNAKKGEVKKVKGKSSGRGKAAKISKPEPPANSGIGIVHPLLIPHVLEKVFEHIICPKSATTLQVEEEMFASVVKDVQNLRLVCKQWKETATLLYRRNRSPIIEFGMICKGPALRRVNKDMEYFVDDMKNSKLIPFQRYKLTDDFFVIENQQLIEDFMRICGPGMVELELRRYHCDQTMDFTRESFPNLNLKRLKKVKFVLELTEKTDIISVTNETVYLIETLLGVAETLQEFHFRFIVSINLDGEGMAKRFGDSICKRIPKTVKILRLNVPLNGLHLNALMENELKLEELELDFDVKSGIASSKVIRKIFQMQAATLKNLTIFTSSSVSLDFPRFDELLYLEIMNEGAIHQFSFPDTFPKLNSLNMETWWDKSTCVELLSSRKEGMSLKEIHLPEKFLFPQAPLVQKVAQTFPNISKLNISPGPLEISETLQEIFVYLPNIEELFISFPHELDIEFNTDSVFSGVSEQDCQRIWEAGNFDMNLTDVQCQPSFLNLTKLQKLVLGYCADINLTDFTAHLFLEMACLKELHTHRLHSYSKMSTKYLGLLREKLTLKLDEDLRCKHCRPDRIDENADDFFASDDESD